MAIAAGKCRKRFYLNLSINYVHSLSFHVFHFRCLLSFVGVYLITGDRDEEKEEAPSTERNELFAGNSLFVVGIFDLRALRRDPLYK